MKVILIIPTGIRCEIGGHSGDANPVAKLIGSTCNELILHPNVVNASDINEMPNNALYVEGSMLDRFLCGEIELQKVHRNKVLVIVNSPLNNSVVNSVSAARATIGLDAEMMVLKTPLKMKGYIQNNHATGDVEGIKKLIEQVRYHHDIDAIAISSYIEVDRNTKLNYFKNGGINPWGGIEAIVSRTISTALNKPVAHAPCEDVNFEDKELYFLHQDKVIDPRMSAEVVSINYLHCVLKGLHKAPKIGKGLSVKDIDFLVSPDGCWRFTPHTIAQNKGVKIIVVKENKTCLNNKNSEGAIIVENYLEATGIIMTAKAGICPKSIRRPIRKTRIVE